MTYYYILSIFWLTSVLSMWSCRESISRSPTGCQEALVSSAHVSRRSSWSIELCRSWRRSKARSTWLCHPPTCPFRRSQRSFTSPVCLQIARAKPRAFSSGVGSEGRQKSTLIIPQTALMVVFNYPLLQASLPFIHMNMTMEALC